MGPKPSDSRLRLSLADDLIVTVPPVPSTTLPDTGDAC
jgi:hypothetical protein